MSFIIDPYRYASCPAEALAFIAAAGITDSTQKQAICTLVSDLKAYGLWNKMKAIYPFCGSTATQQKYNLKDPRDLDAAFRLVFNGGWTHSSTGATGSINGYADTFYNPSVSGILNSAHLSYYQRSTENTTNALLGGNTTSGTVTRHYFGRGNTWVAINSSAEGNYVPSSFQGLHLAKRENSTQTKQFYNGSLITTSTISSTSSPNVKLYINARNSGGTAQSFAVSQCAFASIGDGLTDTEAANLYTAVQAYQTTLSRNV